ncbi:MAG: UPF0175 family protein [Desulfotomaculum sp.]|nr:UPF0175 family protein [Desulfotomaculum sp.]
MEVNLPIPTKVYLALKIPEKEKKTVLLTELAISLYQRAILSFGKARELAQMDKWVFHKELNKRNIVRHYHLEDLEEDLQYGRGEEETT